MCGIAGFFNPKIDFSDNLKSNINILNNMIKSMKMRGPDDDGYSIINHCCFAHTRLSIIDLADGKQPMKVVNHGLNYHIVFNGEIYNHPEIKDELLSLGYVFNTKSDTEIIANAFIHWGAGFAKKLNGIFAIAIYDEQRNTLYLFRDHFGIKPLYYTRLGDTTVFSSRIDSLFEYPRIRPALDINGFNEIFTIGPAKTYGNGVFTNIKEVLPGEYIVITPETFSRNMYYKIESRPHTDSYEETIEKTSYLVEDSIRRQMISDVPICTFLSGGIDSSLVTSVCAKYLDKDEILTTYSFDFEDNDIHFQSNSFQPTQDRPYVDIMKDYLHTNHIYLSCKYETLADLLEPSVDSRCLPTMADVDSSLLYFCSEVAKNHKVTLTGECADEIFGGYPWFHKEEMIKANTFPWMRDISFRKSLLNPEFAAVLHMEQYIANAYEKTISEIDIIPSENDIETSRRRISYLNIRWFMQTLLDRMDRTSMHSGLEARVPFADHRIVDYVFNIPWEMKAKDGIPKNLLRQASKYFLPDEVLNRPKNPYPKTYHPKYEEILVNRLKEVINDSASPLRSYLNIPAVNKFLDSPKEYGKPWYGQLMAGPQMVAYLLQIDYWMRKYSLSL
ncbi:MAG: asparagine synthase (glutamine-hydrolyzing) [Lachnospiraceae bacterium]|nr:asparagine synthase (glutamine-hydrolyzing) [Lachnospiraceae bacterium]MBQ9608757.1 asparagine synthase (glutamine-hydrolyzing) [Lachnospiraceae bacterium]